MANQTTISSELFERLELMVLHSDFQAQPERLEQLIAPEFEEIDKLGRVTPRADVVAWLKNKKPIHRWNLTEFRIKMINDTVVLCIYKAKLQSDKSKNLGSTRSSLWRLAETGWQMVFHQASKANTFQ